MEEMKDKIPEDLAPNGGWNKSSGSENLNVVDKKGENIGLESKKIIGELDELEEIINVKEKKKQEEK